LILLLLKTVTSWHVVACNML